MSVPIAHVAPVSTADELGENPRAKKLPDANRFVICVVLWGEKDDAFLACRLKVKPYEDCVVFAVTASYVKCERVDRVARPNKGFAASQRLLYNFRPKLPAITALTSWDLSAEN